MNTVFVTLQMILLMIMLPVFVLSLRTSRKRRSRHAGFLTVAVLASLLATIVALLSVASSADVVDFEYGLSFGPPALTIGFGLWVIWRASMGGQHRSRPAHPSRRARA